MTRYSAADARARFSAVLDLAERGEDVVVERRGTRFRLVRVDEPRRPSTKKYGWSVDEALLDGDWHWEPGADGQLALVATKAKSPTKKKSSR
jgi:prevent-host-death family protein